MKKKLTALFLALTLVFALGVNAMSADDDTAEAVAETAEAMEEIEPVEAAAEAAEAEETEAATEEASEPPAPSPDAEGTLSFANIGSRMHASYYPMYALQENIDDAASHDYEWRSDYLRGRLNAVADAQWMVSMAGDATTFNMLQSNYDALRDEFDAIKDGDKQKEDADTIRQYKNAQDQLVIYGESIYMAVKAYEAGDATAARMIDQLDRQLQEVRLRAELGQVPAMTVDQLETGRAQAVSQRDTARMEKENYLLLLKSMVGTGLDEPLTLGALPKITAAQLDAMNLEKDLAQAEEVSYSLYDARKQIDDFKKGSYDDAIRMFGSDGKTFESSQAKHALQAMEYQYQDTLTTFELNFRKLYAQVKDAAQVLEAKKTALASQEKSYAVSALKYEQGSISANALADAKDELATAKDNVSGAERDLFAKYHTYRWAVEYGIINS